RGVRALGHGRDAPVHGGAPGLGPGAQGRRAARRDGHARRGRRRAGPRGDHHPRGSEPRHRSAGGGPVSGAAHERAAAGPRTPGARGIGCAMALGAGAFWALRPLGEPEAPSAALAVETDGRVAAAPPPPLDLAAFNAPLWVAAPEPPPPAAPPPPPPPPA